MSFLCNIKVTSTLHCKISQVTSDLKDERQPNKSNSVHKVLSPLWSGVEVLFSAKTSIRPYNKTFLNYSEGKYWKGLENGHVI